MLHKAAAAIVTAAILVMPAPGSATTCNTVAACVLGSNTGSGVGVQGTSTANVGVYGTSTNNHGTDGRSTKSYGAYGITYANGTAAGTAAAGVYGLDSGSGTLNSGVRGLSSRGVGVQGTSTSNVGVYGTSTSNHGTDGRSRTNYGAYGTTYAVGTSAAAGRAGVYGLDSGSGTYNSGVLGISNAGFGVLGEGATGVEGVGGPLGVYGEGTTFGGAFENNDPQNPSFVMVNNAGGPVLEADAVQTAGADPVIVASIDGAGNAIFAGTVTMQGTPQLRTQSAQGAVVSFAARSASPTLEDFGTAQLRNGAASVTLDRTFASTIDARNYMVFITPHGDSNGLYADTTPSGFTVRENKSGRSTLAFDYRIVGRPLDARALHLPAIAPLKRPALHRAFVRASKLR